MVALVISAALGALGVLLTGALLERHKRLVAGRAAARLIENEINDAMIFIEASLDRMVWLDDPAGVITGQRWSTQQDALAGAPGFRGWYPVTGAEQFLSNLARRAAADGINRHAKVGVAEISPQYLLTGIANCEIALEALRGYAKTTSYKSERVRDLQQLTNQVLAHMSGNSPERKQSADSPSRSESSASE